LQGRKEVMSILPTPERSFGLEIEETERFRKLLHY
jgi:hypothetical protein